MDKKKKKKKKKKKDNGVQKKQRTAHQEQLDRSIRHSRPGLFGNAPRTIKERYKATNSWNFFNPPLRFESYTVPKSKLRERERGRRFGFGWGRRPPPGAQGEEEEKKEGKKDDEKMKDEDSEKDEQGEAKEKKEEMKDEDDDKKKTTKPEEEDEDEKEKFIESRKPVIHQQWEFLNKKVWKNWSTELTQTEKTLPLINKFEEMFCPTMFLFLLDDEMKSLLPTLFNLCHLSREELKEKLDGAEKIHQRLKKQVNKGMESFKKSLDRQTDLFQKNVIDRIKHELDFSQRVKPNLTNKLSSFRVKFKNERRPFARLIVSCTDVLELIFQYLRTRHLLLSLLPVCSFFSTFIRTRIPLIVPIPNDVVLLNYPLDIILSSYRIQSIIFQANSSSINEKAFVKLHKIIENNVQNLKYIELGDLREFRSDHIRRKRSFATPMFLSNQEQFIEEIEKHQKKSEESFKKLRETLGNCKKLRSIQVEGMPLPLTQFNYLETISYSVLQCLKNHGRSRRGFGLMGFTDHSKNREKMNQRFKLATEELNGIFDFFREEDRSRRITKLIFTHRSGSDLYTQISGGSRWLGARESEEEFLLEERSENISKLYDCAKQCPNLRHFECYILDGFKCLSPDVAKRLPFIKFVKLKKLAFPPRVVHQAFPLFGAGGPGGPGGPVVLQGGPVPGRRRRSRDSNDGDDEKEKKKDEKKKKKKKNEEEKEEKKEDVKDGEKKKEKMKDEDEDEDEDGDGDGDENRPGYDRFGIRAAFERARHSMMGDDDDDDDPPEPQSRSFKTKNKDLDTHFALICSALRDGMEEKRAIREACVGKGEEEPFKLHDFRVDYPRLFEREKNEIKQIATIPEIDLKLPISFDRQGAGMGFFGGGGLGQGLSLSILSAIPINHSQYGPGHLSHLKRLTIDLTGRVDLGGRPEFEQFMKQCGVEQVRFIQFFSRRTVDNFIMIMQCVQESEINTIEELEFLGTIRFIEHPFVTAVGNLVEANLKNLRKLGFFSPRRKTVMPGIPRTGILNSLKERLKVTLKATNEQLEESFFEKLKKNEHLKILKFFDLKKIQERVNIILNKNSTEEED